MPNLTPEQLAAMREAAEKATQGEWRQHLVDETTVIANGRSVEVCHTTPDSYGADDDLDYWTDAEQCEANAAYIVAAQPRAVLALLDEIERLRGLLVRAEAAIDNLEVRELVAGWNGERLPPEQRFQPHPPHLRIILPTNAGRVYELDATAKAIRAALAPKEKNDGE